MIQIELDLDLYDWYYGFGLFMSREKMGDEAEIKEHLKPQASSETMDKKHNVKGKRLWQKVKYQLVEFHSLPAYLRDNEYIIGHYRSEWPIKQILLSIFTIHNETLNVWT